ncbi:RANBP2-like and GRIP domain-containing protein 8 [Corticium candelabrum]|uniref:RANBP2-like and GRIP domain-containing protein 8 n=1 Tax=Corticium candelabrum TaxID=121492 RepID=UPI002E25B810|nr:RANBP2-like and GRIP domain-containing protein 8 [Corticium candelabrum]
MAAGRQPTDAVDRYVAKLTRQATTGDDMARRGLSLARMYFQVQDLESAKRHLLRYLGFDNRNHSAQKLMGYIYEKLGNMGHALYHYEMSLKLQTQRDVAVKVAQLYCSQPPKDLIV